MTTTRRNMLKLGALAAAASVLPSHAGAAATPIARAERPLRILILGGTGFTGPFQVAYALARGHRVTLFNRGQRAAPEWPGEVEQLHGDRDTGDLDALRGREWDVCIDNPTSVPVWVRDVGQVLRGKVGHYLFISSISVYADGARAGMTEDAPLLAYEGDDPMAETMASLRADVSKFGALKAASEAEAHRQFGDSVTVVRPGYIVGPRDETDRFTWWPHRIARGGEVLVPGDGSDPMQIIDGRDLGEWMIRLAEARRFGVFNAVGPDYRMSTDALVHGIHAVTGGRVTFTHVPRAFLEAQDVAFGRDIPIWLPAEHALGGYGTVDNQRALAAGLTFRPLATTVGDLLQWFASLPDERRANLRAGMSPAREAEVLAAWHAHRQARGS